MYSQKRDNVISALLQFKLDPLLPSRLFPVVSSVMQQSENCVAFDCDGANLLSQYRDTAYDNLCSVINRYIADNIEGSSVVKDRMFVFKASELLITTADINGKILVQFLPMPE